MSLSYYLTHFPKTVLSAATDFTFYKETAPRETLKVALRYFLTLHLLLSLVLAIGTSYLVFVGAQELADVLHQELQKLPEFELGLANGELTTTLPEPFYFLQEELEEGAVVIAIDTTGTIPDLTDYEEGVLVTKDRILYKESRYQTRSLLLELFGDFQSSKAQLVGWLNHYQAAVTAGLIAAVLISTPIFFIFGKLLFVAVFSGLGWIASTLLKRGLTYRQTLQLGLYAITLPSLLDAAVFFTPFIIPNYLKILLFCVFLIGPIWLMKERPQLPVSQP